MRIFAPKIQGRGIVRISALGMLVAGCVGAVDGSVTVEREAIGEAMNGFPSPAERLGIMAINRARSDPETVAGPSSMSYPARPPVLWSYTLSQSARFHAINLELADVTLMHTSPCTLNTDVATTGCTGDPSCACTDAVPAECASCAMADAENDCGTDPFVRIGYFTASTTISATGEVAAAGYSDPMAVVNGWMDEAAGSDGHRRNLTDQGITSNVMGYGHATGSNCWKTFDISDSGNVSGTQIPKIPTAAVSPAGGAAGMFTFYATWADAAGAPTSLNVVVDGTNVPMALELGAAALNATYKATSSLVAGCHTYAVVGVDSGGTTINYPTTGSISLTVGSATCGDDSGAGGAGGAAGSPSGGSTGSGGARTDAGSNPVTGSGGEPGTDAGSTTTNDAGGASQPDGAAAHGGCNCAVASRPSAGLHELTLLVVALLLRRRRSQRR